MIGVGDVVVCVDDGRRFSPDHGEAPETARVKRDGIYRIAWAGIVRGYAAVRLANHPSAVIGLWEADRFRKVLPADPKFVEEIRSLTPHRERELAPSQTSGDS
jgi:hypothetical protein